MRALTLSREGKGEGRGGEGKFRDKARL